ncbi:NAD(P)H-dependent flavin oxidoreductase [Sciscionella sediminilitoris]|uniref:NAD(P)H-dependent flavin oxidoreductase n=1 Tax=Sciscionella sediminilitoris TaxID=1445613 RepID=UPI0004DF44BE|nr:nitronate monooxygenase [Sciscionella sp. SE31]
MSELETPVCALLGIREPVVQAPIGSAASPELAAAVSAAGGLGMLALTWVNGSEAGERIRRVRQLTTGVFGVNLVLDFPVEEVLEVCLGEGVPVISTFWGDPAPLTERVHAAGALHLHTVGDVTEARQAVDAGVDVLVAQGWEAGGHVRGEVSTMALVPAVVDVAGAVPVLAAGGIGDGRGLAAALMLGAQGGWLGTRFLTAHEADTHALYRDRIRTAAVTDTVHTHCFDGGWPAAAHRTLRNSTVTEWRRAGCPAGEQRPGAGTVVAVDRAGREHLRYADMIPTAGAQGELEALAMYAGQSAGLVHTEEPAARILSALVRQARETLAGAPR